MYMLYKETGNNEERKNLHEKFHSVCFHHHYIYSLAMRETVEEC